MKLNVFFLLIDGLRADRIYGTKKSAKTPNFDNLKNNGIYFTQAISSGDQTGLCMASVFTGKFPSTSGISQFNFDENTDTIFQDFKKNGYSLYALIPDVSFLLELTKNFDSKIVYEFENRKNWKQIREYGPKLIKFLKSDLNKPWFLYAHLEDISPPFLIPEKYEGEEYGKDNYDKIISSLDVWLGKFLSEINLDNTLIVLTSDHGEYIPVTNQILTKNSNMQNLIREKTKSTFLKKIGLKSTLLMRNISQTYEKEKLRQNLKLSKYEMRAFNSRNTIDLYDELIRIPLLIAGGGIKQTEINSLVRQVDVFPTLADFLNIPIVTTNLDGMSLVPLINGENLDEVPAYIETGLNLSQIANKKSFSGFGKKIGIRTSKFKFYRDRVKKDSGKTLFDLSNDPLELKNIANLEPKICQEMEQLLQKILENMEKTEKKIGEDKAKFVQEELEKLGYM